MTSSFGARFVRRLWIACLAALFISLAAKSAYACTPFPPTPWFNENINLLNSNLPNGIRIKQDGHTVSLTNNLDTSSFYINLFNGPQELGKSVEIRSYDNELSANAYYWINLEPRNKIQDNRPNDVKLPEPQDSVAQIILNQKTYSFQFTISYELNDHYIRNSVYDFDHACQGFYYNDGLNYPVLFVVGLIILLVLIYGIKILREKNVPGE